MFEWHAYGHVALSDSYHLPTSPVSRGTTSISTPSRLTLGVTATSSFPRATPGRLMRSATTAGSPLASRWQAPQLQDGRRHGHRVATRRPLAARPHAYCLRQRRDPEVHSQSRVIRERIDWAHARSRCSAATCVPRRCWPAARATTRCSPMAIRSSAGAKSLLHRIRSHRPDPLRRAHALTGSPTAPTIPLERSPAASPAVAVTTGRGTTTVHASWNGATGVSAGGSWRERPPPTLRTIATAREHWLRDGNRPRYTDADFAVQALGAAGEVLGTSPAAHR